MAIYLPIVSEFKPGGVTAAGKALDTLTKKSGSFSGSLKKAGKIAGTALLGVGAAAGGAAFAALELAKGAAEDEAAQAQLAKQLQNTTGATDRQIESIEKFISKTALATGVADDELRPALAALVRGSGDAAQAQEDLGLAMDISAGTGKSLDSVSQALAKAYGGNLTALRKLDPQLAKVIEAGGDTKEVFAQLGDTFKGAGAAAANSAQGQFARLTVAFDEAKETLGAKLLPIVLKVVNFLTTKVIPIVEKVIKVFDKRGLAGVWKLVVRETKEAIPKILRFLGDLLVKLRDALAAAGRAFLEWIGPRIGPMLEQLGQLIGRAANWILDDGLPMLVKKLKELGKALVEWIGPRIVPMLKELGIWLGRLTRWMATEAVPKITKAAGEIGVAFLSWTAKLGWKTNLALAEWVAETIKSLPRLIFSLVLKMDDAGFTIGQSLLEGLARGFKAFPGFLSSIGQAFLGVISSAWNNLIVGPLNGAIRKAVDTLDTLLGPINFPDPGDVIPRVQLAKGGIVTGPTTALIGEAGPEAVVPLDRIAGGRESVTINVNGALDPVSVARQIRQILNDDARRRTGTIAIV